MEIESELWNESLEQARIQTEPAIKEALTNNGLPADTTWNIVQIFVDLINHIINGVIFV